MNTVDVMQKVNLVDGVFTVSEARDVINALLKEKINFHKVHRLSLCEGNENSNTAFDDSRLSQLIRAKEEFKYICDDAKAAGKRFRISGILDLELID